jgi:RNA polymerase I-specific transcription initiation factor RRN6
MAGMSQRLELQNAHSTRFLSYGHLGTVTYNEEEKKWKTLRNIVPQVASAHREAVEKEDGYCALPPRHLSSKVVFDGLATLQQDWADSRADEIHPGDNHQSDSASAGTYRRDHTSVGTAEYFQNNDFMLAGGYHVNCSKLLDFGHAVSAAPQKVRSEPVYGSIAASVSGSNRESIRLVRMGDEVFQGPECNAKELSLHPPSISGNGQAYWTSGGGPIQQISFAAAIGYSSTWMAVRLQSSTTIFHPLIHQEPVAPCCETSLPSETLSPSVLDANPILTIPISRTGGHSHADVAFHPQDHMKVALIDEHGNWSVWLLGGERRESLVSHFWANLVCSGKIWTWDHEKRLSSSLPYHDGWHRISWCMSSETQSDELFVCNRRTAVFYNTSGDPHSLTNLRLGHARENQMILDVQLSKSVPGHVFVLTSTCLFWLSFMAPNSGESSRSHETPRTLLVWQHFRDRGDKTLHLVLLETKLGRL